AIIGDPHASQRRKESQSPIVRQVLHKARRAVKSASGKALLRKRGQYIERSFAQVLDQGGLRRTTLRGKANLNKRQLAAALAFDLSLLMRKLTGYGTPKQWLAGARGARGARGAFFGLIGWLMRALSRLAKHHVARRIAFWSNHPICRLAGYPRVPIDLRLEIGRFSTGC
ncbi:MAG: transposase, partial [Luteolibacter sp.]